MTRHVFFSFEYEEDVSRAMVVRNSWVTQDRSAAGFIDAADFEKIEDEGDEAVKNWIDEQLERTSVTVVLIGRKTCDSRWVKYEIEKSIERGNGLLGIDISKIKDLSKKTSVCCGKIPAGHDFYSWTDDNGYENMGNWIEKAAKSAGR